MDKELFELLKKQTKAFDQIAESMAKIEQHQKKIRDCLEGSMHEGMLRLICVQDN